MKGLTVILGCLCGAVPAVAETPRPNFLIIFIDDMGYGDPVCFGGTAARTPQIDKLAAQGTRFTSFYAQTVWPELHVHLTSITDQWAGVALAGPRSRDADRRSVSVRTHHSGD